MRESLIEKHLVAQVKAAGGEVRKVKWIGRRGAPDRIVLMNGFVVFVELKATGKTLEAHQEREHKRMRNQGAWVCMIDSNEAADLLVAMIKRKRGLQNAA
jgi:Holliday junction resolvase-like predicted endonuclease